MTITELCTIHVSQNTKVYILTLKKNVFVRQNVFHTHEKLQKYIFKYFNKILSH